MWQDDYSKRCIISAFLKDKQIGAKRLASMPDRLTNSIDLAAGGWACRPTVISLYSAPLVDIQQWWEAWSAFMFVNDLEVPAKGGGSKKLRPCATFSKIPKAKYPAITEEEETISIPLQALCCAIFDAVLVHMLNMVAPGVWHNVKAALCESLSTNKIPLTLSILETQYAYADVICLQECAASFSGAISSSEVLNSRFHLLVPAELDSKRDQNSLVLIRRDSFRGDAVEEITADVVARAKAAGAGLSPGDLYAAIVPAASHDADQAPFLIASFHGDTDGLMTLPVLEAVYAARESRGDPKPRLIFAMDANAYCKGVEGKKLGAAELLKACNARGLNDCWSGNAAAAPQECCTTFNARTYLQPQLNKAVSRGKAGSDPNTDRNPKDYIIFDISQYSSDGVPERDNTGTRGVFDKDSPFPTLHFPSDHAVLAARIRPAQKS